MSTGLLRNLDERIAGHVLHTYTLPQRLIPKRENNRRTFVSFVHKFEELVHDGFEEFPVRLEEARVLTNDVHDIGRDNGLVILASLHLH